jgi:arsenate reductase
MKKVLILCTGNSCRSILAEGLINRYFENIQAKSAGSKPSGKVNANAKKVLQNERAWRDSYHSKSIDEMMDEDFDLVVTVCDNAKESCPVFPTKTKVVHVGFEDPDGKPYEAFEALAQEMKQRLFPIIQKELT